MIKSLEIVLIRLQIVTSYIIDDLTKKIFFEIKMSNLIYFDNPLNPLNPLNAFSAVFKRFGNSFVIDSDDP